MRTASMVVLCLSTHAAAMHPGSMKRPHPRQSDRISTVVRDDGSVLASAADDAKREWLDRLDAPTWGARQVAHTAAPTVATSAVAPTVGDVGVVVPRGYDIDTTRDQEPNVSSPPLANFKAAHGGVSSRAPRPAAATDVSASQPRTAAELESRIAELTAELAKAGPAPVAATPSAMGGAPAGEQKGDGKKLLQKIKDAGIAGIISYGVVQIGFWGASIPICIFGYYKVTGHWPDLSNVDDQKQLGAEAFAFLNLARLAIPVRIALALSMTKGVQENVVDRLRKK